MADRGGRLTARKPLLFAICATALAGLWLAHSGELGQALRAFARVRVGLLGLVLVRLATLLLCGTAWGVLVGRRPGVPLHVFQRLRLIREGLNVLLPVGAIGGDLVGMRLITFWDVPASMAVASISVDMLLQAAAQAAFTLLGVALLAMSFSFGALAASVLFGVTTFTAALVAFQWIQRRGVKPAARLLAHWVAHAPIGAATRLAVQAPPGLESAMQRIWGNGSRLATATGLHLGAWLIGTLEVWIALAWMGHARSWEVACILESLSQGARSMAFAVPAGLGVQEGSLIAVGHIVGIDPGIALAVSLAKRVPDLLVGIPALVVWPILEARHRGRDPQEAGGAQEL